MVDNSRLRIPLLCRLLDCVNQRVSSGEKLLHFWYVPFRNAGGGIPSYCHPGSCNKDIDMKTSIIAVLYSTVVDVLTDIMSESTLSHHLT